MTAVDAGGAVVDFLHSNSGVVNLVHPRPVPWNTIISHFSKYLGSIPIVPFSEWMSSLSSAHAELDQKATDPVAVKEILSSNPALNFLSLFENAFFLFSFFFFLVGCCLEFEIWRVFPPTERLQQEAVLETNGIDVIINKQ